MTTALTKPTPKSVTTSPSAIQLMAARCNVDPTKLYETLKTSVFPKATDAEMLDKIKNIIREGLRSPPKAEESFRLFLLMAGTPYYCASRSSTGSSLNSKTTAKGTCIVAQPLFT